MVSLGALRSDILRIDMQPGLVDLLNGFDHLTYQLPIRLFPGPIHAAQNRIMPAHINGGAAIPVVEAGLVGERGH